MIQLWYNNQQLLRLTLYKNNTIPHHRHQHLSSPHPLAGIVAAGILYGTVHSGHPAAAAAIVWAINKDSVPRMDKDQRRVDKPQITATNITKQIETVWGQPFSKSKIKPKVCGNTVNDHPVQLQVDTASDITLISQSLWETIGQPSLTSTSLVAQNASGDFVHITGELPATIKLKNKTASGTIYIANSCHNLQGLDFIDPLGLLDIPLNQI